MYGQKDQINFNASSSLGILLVLLIGVRNVFVKERFIDKFNFAHSPPCSSGVRMNGLSMPISRNNIYKRV